MIRSKNNFSGFTLIEAMLSVTVLAILATPLFITQGSVLQAVASYSLHLQRIFYAQNFLYEARNKAADAQKFTLAKKFDNPAMNVKYEVAAIGKKSYLKKIENLVAERLTIEWDQMGQKKKDVMISYLYKPVSAKKTT
ncbi:MAG: prepilin-type N-terminal cleavage/methylation domain-containing protein [Candidatus Babeliales bacterium]|nr:prepilin-type N-terminal cleavage/methylation domain-containing protein [Candidatus Babeliales bacterium]